MSATKKDDKIMDELLHGQVQPDILRDIINSNYYNEETGCVEPKPNVFFRLVIGAEGNLLQYNVPDLISDGQVCISKELKKNHKEEFQFQLT